MGIYIIHTYTHTCIHMHICSISDSAFICEQFQVRLFWGSLLTFKSVYASASACVCECKCMCVWVYKCICVQCIIYCGQVANGELRLAFLGTDLRIARSLCDSTLLGNFIAQFADTNYITITTITITITTISTTTTTTTNTITTAIQGECSCTS